MPWNSMLELSAHVKRSKFLMKILSLLSLMKSLSVQFLNSNGYLVNVIYSSSYTISTVRMLILVILGSFGTIL